jgi:hypothetical protein
VRAQFDVVGPHDLIKIRTGAVLMQRFITSTVACFNHSMR